MMHKCIRLLHKTAIPELDEFFGFETGAFAIDIFGGVFCLHNTVHYFAPDILDFENLQITGESWDEWLKTEQVDVFYGSWYWDVMDVEIALSTAL